MVQFINNILKDEHEFFNIGIIICSSILLTSSITDAITTIKGLSMGLHEANPVMVHIVKFPILFISIKILFAIMSIIVLKQGYDFMKSKPSLQKYSDVLLYIVFAIPSGVVLSAVINNLLVIIHHL